jgi:hypothetical protein
MMASKYLATFEEKVTAWQSKLANVSETLSQMSEVQRKWAYLETLFIGSDEVVKELPDSAARFREIDRTFQATSKGMYAAKNAVLASSSEGLLPALEEMSSGLELCEKALAEIPTLPLPSPLTLTLTLTQGAREAHVPRHDLGLAARGARQAQGGTTSWQSPGVNQRAIPRGVWVLTARATPLHKLAVPPVVQSAQRLCLKPECVHGV